ncbi:MAG: hypothetical protein RIS88_1463 [Pseudomonadota bacterium]|jgi:crotonobetainyl-CoA:carnitine CoA-transferase CaiB-like acyl-CoA transferase
MSRLNRFLEGVRVIDLSWYLPGPLATLLLADLGAEVIKVEPPQGDPMRTIGPRMADGRGLWHEAVNAGKRLLCLDLKQPEGLESLLELLASADVLVESFRPGVLDKLGLGYDTVLRRRNPRLVCVSLSGYGQEGPLRDAAGHDNNYLAQAGFLSRVGPAPDQAALVDPPIADCLGSMFGLTTLLAALLERERRGQGCHIDIALADVSLPLQVFAFAGVGPGSSGRGEGDLNGGWACYGVYRTQEGREAALGAIEPKFWAAFCGAARRPDWIARHSEPRPQHALRAEVAAFFASQTWTEISARYAQVDCCLSLVLTLDESAKSEHARARRILQPTHGTTGWQALYPAHVDGQPPKPRDPLAPWNPASREGRGD